jgi:plasmid replication initiation protein
MRRKHPSERDQLEFFRALPGDLAPRDAQDLTAYPFFSLARTKRVVPIEFHAGAISIRGEAVPQHGIATIWDADVLIWTASQIVEARHVGLKTSRLMAATPYEILTFVGCGTSARDYDRLKAGLDRLQSTTVLTSIRQPAERRIYRFFWINEWKETADANGHPFGLELILPDRFYADVIDDALVLTIDLANFDLTGGPEPWLYHLVCKHGGRQEGGWSFDLVQLHAKSGSLSPLNQIAYEVRQIVQRQTLPGYQLVLTRDPNGAERLNFVPIPVDPFTARLRRRGLIPQSGENP